MTRIALALAAALLFASPAGADLTAGHRLVAVYDTILDARFDRAAALLRAACPPAPAPACKTLEAVAVWWRILITPDDRSRDAEMKAVSVEAQRAAAAWTRSEPRNGEAWFYLAGSYAPLVQWKILRGERLSAARDGKAAKGALERALALDPTLNDAYFGIGLYHYYADVAPAYAKFLRWLLFLPGGDRVEGLAEMERARARGELLTGEADFQLQQIYLWYERRPHDALALLQSLDRRYPANPIFLQRIAEVQDTYFGDVDASIRAWQTLLDRARRNRVALASIIAARAERQLRALREKK